MIKKIYLENFMAHEATSIELASGVTVITGPNNIGKSAIVEAIRYLVSNPAPKNVIRHGALKALVSLELDSGEIIIWQRQEKSASYAIQQPGQETVEYHKFGREVPADVRSLLRMEEVQTDTEDIDIHLGNQRQPIFLLDRPGSHAAAFFAASSEADYLLKMQQALKRRVDMAKASRKALDIELIALDRQLQSYEPLDALEIHLARSEALYAVILETEQQLPVMEDLRRELVRVQAQLQQERAAATVLELLKHPPALKDITGLCMLLTELIDKTRQYHLEAAKAAELINLASLPDLDPTTDLQVLLQQIRESQSNYAATQARFRAVGTLSLPPAMAEVERLHTLVKSFGETLMNLESLRIHHRVLTPAAEPPQLEETAVLEDLCLRLHREQVRSDRLDQTAACLAELPPPPEPENLIELEKCLQAQTQVTADLARLQAHLDDIASQLDVKQGEILTYLQDTGTCPLCGSSLDLKHFLEDRHA